MSLREIIGKNIKYIRLQKKMSQNEAAKLVGLTGSFWGYIERGERNIGVNLIEKISEALDVSPHTLLLGIEDRIPTKLIHRFDEVTLLGNNHVEFIIKVIDAYLEAIRRENK